MVLHVHCLQFFHNVVVYHTECCCVVYLLVWMVVYALSIQVCVELGASLQLMYGAPISASAADDMTAMNIYEIVRIAPLLLGIALLFDMKKCLPALLCALVSKR